MPLLDRLAVSLSGLCVLHCVVSVILVSVLAIGGGLLTDPHIHRIGLALAVVLAGLALVQGYRQHRAVRPAVVGGAGLALMALGLVVPHGMAEIVATVAGVTVLAWAHWLNACAGRRGLS